MERAHGAVIHPTRAAARVPRPLPGGRASVLAMQRTAGNRGVAAAMAQRRTPAAPSSAPAVPVQRHASWEHKMLGDIDPDTLEIIASGRDAAKSATRTVAVRGVTIGATTVAHAIDQEIRRLQYFKTNPPTAAGQADTAKMAALDKSDRRKQARKIGDRGARWAALTAVDNTTWDVRLVAIPLSDGTSGVVTYGELNTLADFYGNPAEISRTAAGNFRRILAGIREESVRKFMRLRNEVGGTDEYDADAAKHGFAGSIGNVGKGDVMGELSLMGKFGMTGKAEVAGRPDTGYLAGLARNACHFAPQSWHSWAEYHQRAIALAQQAHALRQGGATGAADAKESEALLQNGFGDHFLQDSFAAGHLINKTLIMQWFVKWLDAHPMKSDMTTDSNWRAAQAMAYGQPGISGRDKYTTAVGQGRASDPQSAENTTGAWTDRFAAAGLAIPSWMGSSGSATYQVFRWWQGAATADPGQAVMDIRDLKKHSPIKDEATLKTVLRNLHDASGVIHYESYGTGDRAKGVDRIGFYNALGVAKNFQIRDQLVPRSKGRLGKTSGRYKKMAMAGTHKDYTTFLDNSYLQLATNVLHDDFCQNGLTVSDANDTYRFVIYGDNAMLKEGTAEGVRYSASTARMSRDSVYATIATGNEPPGQATADIANRLPRKATANKHGTPMDLGAWHGEGGALWNYCNTHSFPDAAAFFSKGTATGVTTMGTISKDNPHPTEGF